MQVFARRALIPRAVAREEPALLLEGSWDDGLDGPGLVEPAARDRSGDEPVADPAGHASQPAERGAVREGQAARWSLDDAIDSRHAWLDAAAAELAEQIAERPCYRLTIHSQAVSLAWLNALELRYYLVKLLRPILFFQELIPGGIVRRIAFHGSGRRDEDYFDLLRQLCAAQSIRLDAFWTPGDAKSTGFPPNGMFRRAASWLNASLDQLLSTDRLGKKSRSRRIERGDRTLLCGNPAVLGGVCDELVRRGGEAAWLYDRFAFGSFLRWRMRGVRQWNCNSSQAARNRFEAASLGRVEFAGIDLAGPLERWLRQTTLRRGARQTRLLERLEENFERFRPTRLVVDEDATPLARAAIATARRYGAHSFVVQHGAPRVHFGFAPLEADRMLAWGEASRRQLVGWGVPAKRITVTGTPKAVDVARIGLHRERIGGRPGCSMRSRSSARAPRVLLFATVPPRPSRPDGVGYHLTSRSHAAVLRMALASVAQLPEARLVIKLHPRSPDDAVFRRAVALFPQLNARLVRRGSLERLLAEADCVLNCGSSAGFEAVAAGVPVIELVPEGSAEFAPRPWGLFGAARHQQELDRLLERALQGGAADRAWQASKGCGEAFAATGQAAIARIVAAMGLPGDLPEQPRDGMGKSYDAASLRERGFRAGDDLDHLEEAA